MTASPEIVLPPLPIGDIDVYFNGQRTDPAFTAEQVQAFARAAVLADRASVADRGVQAVPGEPVARVYGQQYTDEQRAWCQRYERETTFEPLMCDFEAGNESFLAAAKNSRNWFESWAGDALRRGCDEIPGEAEAIYAEVMGEKL